MIRLRQQCSAITFHMWKVQNVLEKHRKAGSELSVRQMALRPINFSNLGDLVHQGKCRRSCFQWRWLRLLIIRVGWRSRLELIPSHRKDAYRGVATVCRCASQKWSRLHGEEF